MVIMYGSNTERALQLIDKIMTVSASLSIDPVVYRLKHKHQNPAISGSTSTDGGDYPHSHGAGGLTHANPESLEEPHPGVISNVSQLRPVKSDFDAFIGKIQVIDKNIYVRNVDMHNSIGSPYTELYRLQTALNDVISFSRSCEYMGEYVAACTEACRLLNRTMQLAVDAKWATMQFGDYLERGYNYIQGQNPDTTK